MKFFVSLFFIFFRFFGSKLFLIFALLWFFESNKHKIDLHFFYFFQMLRKPCFLLLELDNSRLTSVNNVRFQGLNSCRSIR